MVHSIRIAFNIFGIIFDDYLHSDKFLNGLYGFWTAQPQQRLEDKIKKNVPQYHC